MVPAQPHKLYDVGSSPTSAISELCEYSVIGNIPACQAGDCEFKPHYSLMVRSNNG